MKTPWKTTLSACAIVALLIQRPSGVIHREAVR
jgi:hypothetical protein